MPITLGFLSSYVKGEADGTDILMQLAPITKEKIFLQKSYRLIFGVNTKINIDMESNRISGFQAIAIDVVVAYSLFEDFRKPVYKCSLNLRLK